MGFSSRPETVAPDPCWHPESTARRVDDNSRPTCHPVQLSQCEPCRPNRSSRDSLDWDPKQWHAVLVDLRGAVVALEELRQAAFAENAIGGQFVGKVGSFGHTVARDWNEVAIRTRIPWTTSWCSVFRTGPFLVVGRKDLLAAFNDGRRMMTTDDGSPRGV